jgi:hypothetical protein
MNAEIRLGSSLGFERKRRHREYNNRFSEVSPMVGVSLKSHFTQREIDLMRELVRGDGGDQNKEIGFRLGITEGTDKLTANAPLGLRGRRSPSRTVMPEIGSVFSATAGSSCSPRTTSFTWVESSVLITQPF